MDFGWDIARSNPNRRLLMVEVNKYMPRTYGSNHVHISEVDAVIEYDLPLIEESEPPTKKEWETIGHYIAEMVRTGPPCSWESAVSAAVGAA